MAEPNVNRTPSISALFTKRRVGGIYSILFSFFWSYSQHFWIKDRNKKGQVFLLLYVCVTYRCCFFHSKGVIKKTSILIFVGASSCLS